MDNGQKGQTMEESGEIWIYVLLTGNNSDLRLCRYACTGRISFWRRSYLVLSPCTYPLAPVLIREYRIDPLGDVGTLLEISDPATRRYVAILARETYPTGSINNWYNTTARS